LVRQNGRMNLLLAHGSPDPRHREQAAGLAARAQVVLGDEVRAAFLDDTEFPHGARVLPLFLGEGRHAGADAEDFAQRFAGTLLPPLAQAVVELAEMAVSMAEVLAGSREPAIFAFYRFRHFERLVAGVYAQRKRLPRMSMASLHGAPSCTDMVHFWEGQGVTRLAVQPMLMFGGQSLDAMAAGVGSSTLQIIFGEPLAAHADMPRIVADRLRGKA
jgi:sirohydrochlorin ferrochelatase